MKFLGQKRNFFIQVAKTEKLCPEEQIKENPFSKAKSLLFFFKILFHFFSNPAETFAKVVEIVTYVALEDFEQKNIWNIAQSFNFGQGFKPLSTLRQKYWSFNPKKYFQVCHNCHPGVERNFLRKIISLRRKFLFFSIKFGAPTTFLLFGK